MTNEEYILLHRDDDVRSLALQRAVEGVDVKWCLMQIEGWQKAKEKLPRWAATEGVWFPPALSMQQCSGQQTADYKASLVKSLLPDAADRQSLVDLTGGYGIDFSHLAPLFPSSHYVERNPELCRIAEHNFPVLGLTDVEISCAEASGWLRDSFGMHTVIYIDPARRDGAGRKTVAISDCTPDLCLLQHTLLERGRYVVCKLSPMLDIAAALSVLVHVRQVHVVAVKGECKELLFVLDAGYDGLPDVFAVNLDTPDPAVHVALTQKRSAVSTSPLESFGRMVGQYIYEPNAAVLKAGLQDVVAAERGLVKLHPMSNLFTSLDAVDDFPGRGFAVESYCGFGKKELRRMLSGLKQANITIRNFPSSVADLRRRFRVAEGGDVYLFATTLQDGSHVLLRCRKQA